MLHEFTELQYSTDREGPWALYVYYPNGYYSGRQWFGRAIKYPDEEITIAEAKARADAAIAAGNEVRVCDGGDMLTFHSKDGKTIYGEDFWEGIAQ